MAKGDGLRPGETKESPGRTGEKGETFTGGPLNQSAKDKANSGENRPGLEDALSDAQRRVPAAPERSHRR